MARIRQPACAEDDLTARRWLWEHRIRPRLIPSAGECLLWPGATLPGNRGYLCVFVGDDPKITNFIVARVSLEVSLDRLLDRLELVHHDCEHPLCCNPEHLSVITRAQWNRELHARRRAVKENALALSAR